MTDQSFDMSELDDEQLEAMAALMTPHEERQMKAHLKDLNYQIRLQEGKDNLIPFAEMMMPDPDHSENVHETQYQAAQHHHLIAKVLEAVERGDKKRVIIVMPPRHGKSELVTRNFPAWFLGKDPSRQVILAGYNSDFAKTEFGFKIKQRMETDWYKEMFPEASLDGGSKAVGSLQLKGGGQIVSAGMDTGINGKGAHLFVLDDPIKNKKMAQSPTYRDTIWEEFTTTIFSRLMTGGRVVIVMTRWHEDDIIGRLTDPNNRFYVENVASKYEILHLPAIFEEEFEPLADKLGRKVGDALWPGMFPLEFLEEIRDLNPDTFHALYQGTPTPADGDLFSVEQISEYSQSEMPEIEDLIFYGASDHGASTKTSADPSVVGTVGVDKEGVAWVMPDLVWARMPTDRTVSVIVGQMKKYKPLLWWLESELISKSFGPFLKQKMVDEGTLQTILDPKTPSTDKVLRAQALLGMMSLGRIRFPKFAPWWPKARTQLLAFPNGSNDDFVDFGSWIGQGLLRLVPKTHVAKDDNDLSGVTGTIQWVKHKSNLNAAARREVALREIGY